MAGSSIQEVSGKDNMLLKTIKVTKNLFSLTERLPMAKYRNYSTIQQKSGNQILEKLNVRTNSINA